MKHLFSTFIICVCAILLFRNTGPSADITAVVLSYQSVRLPNVVQIVSVLCKEPVLHRIVVWNNNNLRPLLHKDFPHSCPKLQIYNSPENSYFQARFLACANASTPYCFIQDDDYLVPPEIVRSLRARITSHDIFLAPPEEWLASRLLSLQSTNITFGFAWLGYGSLILRSNARAFLSLLDRLDLFLEEKKMADNYYSILRNRFPEVWIASPRPLSDAGAFTVGTEGVERNRRHITSAAAYLDANIADSHSLPYLLTASASRQDSERSPCLRTSCVLETTVKLLPDIFTAETHSAARDVFAREKLLASSLSHEFTANVVDFPVFYAVDGDLNTTFRSPLSWYTRSAFPYISWPSDATAGDTFVLDMLVDVDGRDGNWIWLVDENTAKALQASMFFGSSDKISWERLSEPECSPGGGECRVVLKQRWMRYLKLRLDATMQWPWVVHETRLDYVIVE